MKKDLLLIQDYTNNKSFYIACNGEKDLRFYCDRLDIKSYTYKYIDQITIVPEDKS